MGKKSKSADSKSAKKGSTDAANSSAAPALPFLAKADNVAFDPSLASLFEHSAGPVQAPSFLHVTQPYQSKRSTREEDEDEEEGDDEELSSADEELDDDEDEDVDMSDAEEGEDDDESEEEESEEEEEEEDKEEEQKPSETDLKRKRKRGNKDEEDLEESYMRRIAKEESREEEKKKQAEAKRRKLIAPVGEDDDGSSSDEAPAAQGQQGGEDKESSSDSEPDSDAPPAHETVTHDVEKATLERSQRTIFLSNVSVDAIRSKSAKKTLMSHLSSFLSTLPASDNKTPHAVESLRFRSVAFSDTSMPKRAAYAKKELMDTTTRSTNAYVVYTTQLAARKAPGALNGSVVLDRHIRADSVAHPAATDHRRCVFVGNLDFVDKEHVPSDDEDERRNRKKKNAPPADVEEGLWRVFNEHCKTGESAKEHPRGPVESVRVVRDPVTRIGKGFAYVQFYDPNSVEQALVLDGQKFPRLLPRKLRVTRARKVNKRAQEKPGRAQVQGKGRRAQQDATMRGRATKLLGRAGAAKLSKEQKKGGVPVGGAGEEGKVFVFEGHRASEKGADKMKVKVKSRGTKGKRGSRGKPKTRSARRGAAFKASGKQK